MDTSIAPGDDFFTYANGAWLRTHEIPADLEGIGTGQVVFEETRRRTAELIKLADQAAPGTEARKIGDFYASFMDEAAIEAKGVTPIAPYLDAVARVTDEKTLASVLGSMMRADVDVLNNTTLETPNLFGLWIAQDLDDPKHNVPYVLQGGLSLGSPSYYLTDSPKMAEVRDKFKAHVAAMLRLIHVEQPDDNAARVLALETLIAQTHASPTDTMNVHKGNNHWPRAELTKRAPGLDWDAYLQAAGLANQSIFVIWHPDAITKIAALVHAQPLASWRAWLLFHTVSHWARLLPKAFADESFAFFGVVLRGVEQQRERWKRGVDLTNQTLGEPVGKLYVERYFPPEVKARAEAMVKNEIAAFAKRIDNLAWMTPATKAKAKEKLAVLKIGVGYPDHWRDYEKLQIARDDVFGNVARADLFDYQYNLAKLGAPVDRGEWFLSPQTVDAQNLPAMLAMTFPAAILQPPFFDPSRPAAFDYGAAGAVIGHEISHCFDDMGADFDATGRVVNWWTPEDYKRFKESGAQLAAQYDAYKPLSDLAINGQQTLSENIADTAGLAVAYDAYRASLGGTEAPTIQGLTGDQQFFISFGQAWRQKTREPLLRRILLSDIHSPAPYRAATVRNLDAWYTAFHVEPGQKLYLPPDQRVHVW